ncbi:hypothetical protein B0H10DRAFT_2219251 [Mycena sp. CBHHK59/15]|nr:hypothetical protein B0H10DRAFT_2219251 [Mycena sp. CBHHK59/15]
MTDHAECEGRTGKIPTLTAGELTLLVIDQFRFHCKAYFSHKGTVPASQVASILCCFRDVHVVNWLRDPAEKALVVVMTFDAFLAELRTKFLRKDWEQTNHVEIMSSRMLNSKSFDRYYTRVVTNSSLLIGTTTALSNTRIRHIIEAGIIPDLQLSLNNDAIAEAALEMRRLDEERLHVIAREHKIAVELRREEACNDKHKADGDLDRKVKKPASNDSGSRATSQAPSTSSTSTSTRCPALTDSEHALLKENQGCFKCRRVFVTHTSHNCPNGFPSRNNYRPVTTCQNL